MTSLSGQRVGRYEVGGIVGVGAMGEVYLALDPSLKRSVVIKRLHPADAHNAQRTGRLAREARLHGRLSHPNIVRVYDFIHENGADHIVSELVSGGSLRELMRAGPLPVPRLVQVLLEIARGLRFAHEHGVVHRDLKADNVLVADDGAVKITDFGLSRSLLPRVGDDDAAGADHAFAGTLLSMSPEQTFGRDLDGRSDLFALGVLAHELATGISPFAGPTAIDVLENVRKKAHQPLREIAPSVPLLLSELTDRLLAKRPDDRPASAAEVVDVLERVAADLTFGHPVPTASVALRQVAVLHVRLHASEGTPVVRAQEFVDFQLKARALAVEQSAHFLYGAGREVVLCIGYPRGYERSACVAASLVGELAERIATAGTTAALGAGIDVGEIAVHDFQPTPVLTGAPLERAISIGREAGPGRLLASARARGQLTLGGFRVRSASDGASAAIAALDLVEVDRGAEEATLVEPIGREALVEQLCAAARAADGAGRVIDIEGEGGIGKSALLRAFLRRHQASGGNAVATSATPNGGFVPFELARRILAGSLDLGREGGSDARARIAAIAGGAPEQKTREAAAARVLGVATAADDAALAELIARRGPDAIASEAGAFLLRMAEATSLVLVVEDLHWADRASLVMIERMVRGAELAPLVLIMTRRSELRPPWPARPHLTHLPLARLNRAESAQIIDRLAAGRPMSPVARDAILARAEGVPLWIEELTESALDGGPSTSAVPASLRESVQHRIHGLGPAVRRVAETLAAFGHEMPLDLLGASADRTSAQLAVDLDELERRSLVRRSGLVRERTAWFRHALLGAAIYGGVEGEPRRALHAAIARGLDLGRDRHKDPELFAHHYERAGRRPEALAAWREAGEQAAKIGAPVVAIANYERAIELVAAMPESEQPLVEHGIRQAMGLSIALAHGMGSRVAEQNNAAMHRLMAKGARPSHWSEMYHQWAAAYIVCDIPSVSTWLGLLQERADALAAEGSPESGILHYMLSCARGIIGLHLGALDEALGHFEHADTFRPQVLVAFKDTPEKSLVSAPGAYSSWCTALFGDRDATEAFYTREEAMVERGSVEWLTMSALIAHVDASTGYFDIAAERARRIVDAPPESMPPNYVHYSRFIWQVSDIHLRLGREDGLGTSEEAQAAMHQALRDLWTHIEGTVGAGLKISIPVQIALLSHAALDIAKHPRTGPWLRAQALELARGALERCLADLAHEHIEQLHRYYVSEVHRAHARLAAEAGERAAMMASLHKGQLALDQLTRLAGRPPAVLIDRLNATREALL